MLVWMKNPFEKPETQPECVFAGSADAKRAPWLVIRAKDPGQKGMSEEGSSTSSLPSATTLPNKGQSALQHTKFIQASFCDYQIHLHQTYHYHLFAFRR